MLDTRKPWRPTRRRLLATGTAALAAPMVLCGRARAQTEPLKFWQFYAPGGDVPAQVNWFTSLVDDWNASHEQQIALEFVPSSEYMGSKLTTAFASGDGPDIFLVSPGDFLRYYNGGALLDLTPYITAQDFVPSVLASRMVDGRIFAVPMEVEPMAMFYSIKAFEDAGLNENDVPKTWDELLAVADKLTNDERYGVLFDVTPGFYQNFTWYPFMWQAGGAFQTEDGKSAFGGEGVVRALKLWKDAVDMGVAPRQVLGGGGWDTVPNLGSGYCAIQNVGVWGMAQMDSGAPDVPYGVFQLPKPADGQNVSVGGGWAFCANARGANPEAAGEFCGWALASQQPASVERMVNWCTVAKTNLPPRTSAVNAGKDMLLSGKMATFSQEILPTARAEPRVPPEVYKSISDAIQAAMLGGVAPEDAAASASEQLDAFLNNYDGAPIL